MYALYNWDGINERESQLNEKHVIIFLFVKPGDKNFEEIVIYLNYMHQKSDNYCSIYLIGYSPNFMGKYKDAQNIVGPEHTEWQYSDKCFIEVCEQMGKRLNKWKYSGEPEMIILQNSNVKGNALDFRGYVYIDINYGIKKEYIDSFQRFMERLLNACKSEVTAKDALKVANKKSIKCRNVLEQAIEDTNCLPISAKKVLKDAVFYKPY